MILRHFKRPLLDGEYDDDARTACGRVILWRVTSDPARVTCLRCCNALAAASSISAVNALSCGPVREEPAESDNSASAGRGRSGGLE